MSLSDTNCITYVLPGGALVYYLKSLRLCISNNLLYMLRSSMTARRRAALSAMGLLRFASLIEESRNILVLAFFVGLEIGRVKWWLGGWTLTK